jgi:hypothetical protein
MESRIFSSLLSSFLHFDNLVYPIINKFNITFTSEGLLIKL